MNDADRKGCGVAIGLAVLSWLFFWGFASLVSRLVEGATP